MNILLLEDDELFCESLVDFLDEYDFVVDVATNGQEVLDKTYEKRYDLYIFDINVPQINGLEVLKMLRNSDDATPTIFLTSYKDQQTLHTGFLNGADDYLKKPVDLDELYLRIQSLMKRHGFSNDGVQITPQTLFIYKNQKIIVDGKQIDLPIKVNTLLNLLVVNNNRIVSKEQIMSTLWTSHEECSDGSVRVYINQIKKLIPELEIKNIKGVGYQIQF